MIDVLLGKHKYHSKELPMKITIIFKEEGFVHFLGAKIVYII